MKKFLVAVCLLAFSVLAAVGLGLYVYPVNPYLVWSLLLVCWAVFRLHRYAQSLFDKANQGPDQNRRGVHRRTPPIC